MHYTGNLIKMETELINGFVNYSLKISEERIEMNSLLNKAIKLKWHEEIECIACGNKTLKSFGQGYCYPCFISVPQTAPCILKPELCEAHKGISRDMKWAEENCLQNHIVYLALTGGLKVGVTRKSQVPYRWMDQGAVKAIRFAETPNRYLAGMIETDLKKYISDKTSWQKMLKGDIDLKVDLLKEKKRASELLNNNYKQYIIQNDEITDIEFPVTMYPKKVRSINLETEKTVSELLVGIKGQYLIFSDGSVINIRKYNGYKITLTV